MEWSALASIIGVIAAICGIVFGWIARSKSDKKEVAHDAATDSALRSDVDYIKRGVDDIKVDMRVQASKIDDINSRLIRNEESTKNAHKRIDTLEKDTSTAR